MSVLLDGLNYHIGQSVMKNCDNCIFSWRAVSREFRDTMNADEYFRMGPEFQCMVPWLLLNDFLGKVNVFPCEVDRYGICDAFSARPDDVNDIPSFNEMKIALLSRVKLTVVKR